MTVEQRPKIDPTGGQPVPTSLTTWPRVTDDPSWWFVLGLVVGALVTFGLLSALLPELAVKLKEVVCMLLCS